MPTRSTLVYGTAYGASLIFMESAKAEALDAFCSADTWGELRRRSPQMCSEVIERIRQKNDEDDDWPGPSDDTAFELTDVAGDGWWPMFPEQLMLELIPQDIQDQYGKTMDTALDGSLLQLDPHDEQEVVDALVAAGFNCRKDQDLFDRIFA